MSGLSFIHNLETGMIAPLLPFNALRDRQASQHRKKDRDGSANNISARFLRVAIKGSHWIRDYRLLAKSLGCNTSSRISTTFLAASFSKSSCEGSVLFDDETLQCRTWSGGS